MKIAIVHDWLVIYAGAERVLEQILVIYPTADLYSLIDFVPASERGFLGGRGVRTSFLQHLPGAQRHYRNYLPLMPLAVRRFDLSAYDLVISSSYAVAKGVPTSPRQLHVCYCHSPMRYAWDLQEQYLEQAGLASGLRSRIVRGLLERIRSWDYRTAQDVDEFVANSCFISSRIRNSYGRDSTVIYPPVDTDWFTPGSSRADFFVTASRMVPYKRVDLIVEAFAGMPEQRLIVIGDGPEAARVAAKAGPNIRIMGPQPAELLREHLQRARAFVFAAQEDFGIAPVEALSCGTPVIAYGKGGVLESVRGLDDPVPTGVFFEQQSVSAIQQAVERFRQEQVRFSAAACRESVLRFGIGRFRRAFKEFIEEMVERNKR